ncbi:hypothetical protein ILYODFUR_024473 [Ilyodon furcidens]|uniref:Uncharacterized protein n=1 Tax=Ilyodon furcidens TaxID=33524 RepID=A0ABV0SZV7_9TELE
MWNNLQDPYSAPQFSRMRVGCCSLGLGFWMAQISVPPCPACPYISNRGSVIQHFRKQSNEAFFNFISPIEKDVLTEALDNFTMADEELLSILTSHNCTLLPTKGNLLKLVEEIAHKEMVQEPAFIIKCWQPILISVGESMSCDGLNKILDDLKPRARNITKCIRFPGCMSDTETITSHQLLRFIREKDEKVLGLFLRYCTGSELFLAKTIKVTFSDMSEFTRRLVAHTCSCLLELPCNYSNYAEFKSEFCSVLKSGVWVMDMS